jgi:hypothetical protein
MGRETSEHLKVEQVIGDLLEALLVEELGSSAQHSPACDLDLGNNSHSYSPSRILHYVQALAFRAKAKREYAERQPATNTRQAMAAIPPIDFRTIVNRKQKKTCPQVRHFGKEQVLEQLGAKELEQLDSDSRRLLHRAIELSLPRNSPKLANIRWTIPWVFGGIFFVFQIGRDRGRLPLDKVISQCAGRPVLVSFLICCNHAISCAMGITSVVAGLAFLGTIGYFVKWGKGIDVFSDFHLLH